MLGGNGLNDGKGHLRANGSRTQALLPMKKLVIAELERADKENNHAKSHRSYICYPRRGHASARWAAGGYRRQFQLWRLGGAAFRRAAWRHHERTDDHPARSF